MGNGFGCFSFVVGDQQQQKQQRNNQVAPNPMAHAMQHNLNEQQQQQQQGQEQLQTQNKASKNEQQSPSHSLGFRSNSSGRNNWDVSIESGAQLDNLSVNTEENRGESQPFQINEEDEENGKKSKNSDFINDSFVSETGFEIRDRLKKAKKEFDIRGTPMPVITMEHCQKMMECVKPTDDFFAHFEPGKLLGQGTICEGVYICECIMTGEKFAVKILDKGKMKRFESRTTLVSSMMNLLLPLDLHNSEVDNRYRKEIAIMERLNHPNIVRLERYFVSKTRYFIVMELASGEELFQILNKKKKRNGKENPKTQFMFTKKQIHDIMRDLLSAVSTMHFNGIIHGDLKLENIRFQKKGVNANVKIYDFGSAILHEPGQLHYQMRGSPYYAAPEMLSGAGYTEKCDIWSLGIIFHYLLLGFFPYDQPKDMEVLHLIQKFDVSMVGPRYSQLTKIEKSLLKRMLSKTPEGRISASEARQHPYFTFDEFDKIMIRDGLIATKNFLRYGTIQKCFLRLYVDKIQSHKQQRSFRQLFYFLNKQSTGQITMDELYKQYQLNEMNHITRDTVQLVFDEIDFDAGGSVDYDEFIVTCVTPHMILNGTTVENLYQFFQPNAKGKLKVWKIVRLLRKYSNLDITDKTFSIAFDLGDKYDPNALLNKNQLQDILQKLFRTDIKI